MASATTDRRLGLAGNTAYKTAATVLSTANITQSGEQTISTIDVKAVNSAGGPDRVLCVGMTDPTKNGLWDVQTSAWTRSIDANGNYDLAQGTQVIIKKGTAAFQIWVLTSADPITIGSTSLVWSQSLSAGSFSTLAASGGSALIGFAQAGTGAVLRTIQDKLRDRVSAFDFMTAAQIADVLTNALTLDVTAAIQAALNTLPNGGEIFFPAGSYKITSALTVAGAGVSVRGKNHYSTRIVQYTSNVKIFDSLTDFFCLSDMRLDYAVTPVSGGTAINCVGNFPRLHNFYIGSCHIGVNISTGVGGRVWAHDIRGYVSCAVSVSATNDHFFSDFIYDALNATNGALGGIRLTNKAEAITFQNGDVLNGVYPMTTDGTYTAGSRPAYCNFTDVYFDSAAQSAQLDKMVLSTFVGCWWSNGRSAGGYPGLSLLQTEAIKFVNCEWFNCGGAGVTVGSSSKNTSFVNPSVYSNSVSAGAGVAHGMVFSAGAHDFSVIGGAISNGLGGVGTQGNGIFIDTGCTNYSILGVNVAGNTSAGVADGSGVGFISKCPGFSTEGRGAATIVVGQTAATVTHGLSVTPLASDILVTPSTSPTASGVATWYITAVGATTFQIAVNAAVATSNLGFVWQARTKGA